MRYRPLLAPAKVLVLAMFFAFSGIHGRAQQNSAEHTTGVELPFGHRPKAQEIRDWINSHPRQGRKEAIAAFHEQIGKPYLDRTRKQPEYKPPGISDADTREFVFKRTPVRNLKLFVDYPTDWNASDRRPAIVFWHGGGFTQGNAGQFYHQANEIPSRVRDEILRDIDTDKNKVLEGAEVEALIERLPTENSQLKRNRR